jgi:hypothetical protein
MWHPTQAALRAGEAEDTEWDGANIGFASAAFGRNTIASGRHSLATGFATDATGNAAAAFGGFSQATGDRAVAHGSSARAIGDDSFAMGRAAAAWGNVSTAFGVVTSARAYASFVIGRYNAPSGVASPDGPVPTDPLFVAGNGTTTTRSNALTLLQNGNLTIAGTLTESSDIRLKTDVEPVAGALNGVLRLTPIRYRYRPGTGHPAGRQIGLSAQEVRAVFPELVTEDLDGYLSVAYTDLAAVLVGAVKDQQTEIQRLRAEVSTLRADLDRVTALLEAVLAGPHDDSTLAAEPDRTP